MGFFSNIFRSTANEEEMIESPSEALTMLIDYINSMYFSGKMYSSGYYQIGGGGCLFSDKSYGSDIKTIRHILTKLLTTAPKMEYSWKAEDEGITWCKIYQIPRYKDTHGIYHRKNIILHITTPPNVTELLGFSDTYAYQHFIRWEYIHKKDWNATVSRFYYYKCADKQSLFDINRYKEIISDFSIQNCNNNRVYKEWVYGKADPYIWERASNLEFMAKNHL